MYDMRISIFRIMFLCICVLSYSSVSAAYVTQKDAFTFLGQELKHTVPQSYTYIDTKFIGVPENTPLHESLKVLVYLNKIPNTPTQIASQKPITTAEFLALSDKLLWLSLDEGANLENPEAYIDYATLPKLHTYINQKLSTPSKPISITIWDRPAPDTQKTEKQQIFDDVYKTLTQRHFDRDSLDEDTLMDAAIEGLADGAEDPYTVYFPPQKSDNFFESLDGEYEGIGAYVHMPEAGKVEIVSPMVDSPAQEAWLKAGDIVTHVDGQAVTKENSLREVTSWIKWPKDSSVMLTIERNGKTMEISVKRGHIVIKDIEYKKLDATTGYLQIKNFSEHVEDDFLKALQDITADRQVRKIIFDVRNNPGGYLAEVSQILGYFLPEWSPTATMSYGKREISYTSHGNIILNPRNYQVIILQNAGSASASEIFAGTMKDYFSNIIIMGDKSYGKGSVQTLKSYRDGSTLKYTSAKWFTGKTHRGIDGVGITPDVSVEFSDELWKQFKKDSQLDAALRY